MDERDFYNHKISEDLVPMTLLWVLEMLRQHVSEKSILQSQYFAPGDQGRSITPWSWVSGASDFALRPARESALEASFVSKLANIREANTSHNINMALPEARKKYYGKRGKQFFFELPEEFEGQHTEDCLKTWDFDINVILLGKVNKFRKANKRNVWVGMVECAEPQHMDRVRRSCFCCGNFSPLNLSNSRLLLRSEPEVVFRGEKCGRKDAVTTIGCVINKFKELEEARQEIDF